MDKETGSFDTCEEGQYFNEDKMDTINLDNIDRYVTEAALECGYEVTNKWWMDRSICIEYHCWIDDYVIFIRVDKISGDRTFSLRIDDIYWVIHDLHELKSEIKRHLSDNEY